MAEKEEKKEVTIEEVAVESATNIRLQFNAYAIEKYGVSKTKLVEFYQKYDQAVDYYSAKEKGKVRIEGKEEGSKIYFLTGGVYGDGNLCLVKGVRTIELENYNTNAETLKTFRSLQRADKVILRNTDIVLLGAVDLVEEGDNTVYSINRINTLLLENGSTVKLDQIVKYLGQIESDYEFLPGDNTKRRAIHRQLRM